VGEERLELDDAAYVDADLEQRGIARHRRDGQVAAVGASGAADRGGIREPGVHQISGHVGDVIDWANRRWWTSVSTNRRPKPVEPRTFGANTAMP
jgi:hypothetical protein